MICVYGNKIIGRAVELIGSAFRSQDHRPVIKNLEILAAGEDGPIVNCEIFINPHIHAVEITGNCLVVGLFDMCHNRNHFRWAQLREDQAHWNEFADN